MTLKFYILITSLSIAIFANGQEPYKLNFIRYGIEDGLSNISMRVLGQDSTGFIWLTDPLTRFDGVNFKTFFEDESVESSGLISAFNMTDDGQGNLSIFSREHL